MAIIIGGGSSVTASSLLVNGNGVVSVNFGLQASIERLWQLGNFDPYDATSTSQRSFGLNVYGKKPDGSGGTVAQAMAATTSCIDSPSVSITFNPSACGGAVTGFTDTFFATSYSYSKENIGYGQETWQFTSKPIIPGYTGTIYMLRGIATGQVVTGTDVVTEAEMGVIVDVAASQDASSNWIESESGSVSSGFPGIGNMDVTREVVLSSVGASTGKSVATDGKRGTASASIPVQAIYV